MLDTNRSSPRKKKKEKKLVAEASFATTTAPINFVLYISIIQRGAKRKLFALLRICFTPIYVYTLKSPRKNNNNNNNNT